MTGPSTSLLRIGVDPAQALNLSVTGDADAPVIRLAGPLRRRDAPAVRETLRHAMVGCPAAVVVDLTGLVVLDDDAMRVFPAVRRGGDWWPGTELIAAAPSPKVRALLDAQPDLFDRCLPSADEALIAAWCDGARPRSVREPIAPSAGAARRGREVIHQFCATWDLEAILPRASAVVTELVDNAVNHADGDDDVTLTASVWRDYLRIAVRDRDPGPLPRSRPGRLDAFGYGRRLVEECSVNWGVSETSNGKIVWSTLHIPRAAGALDTPRNPDPDPDASPAPAPPPPPVFTAVHNRRVSLVLTKQAATIGRTADNDLVLDDPSVSRNHALIKRTRDRFVLVDLGSVNGVWLNGCRLRPHRPFELTDAATVRIGNVELTFAHPLTPPRRHRAFAAGLRRLVRRVQDL